MKIVKTKEWIRSHPMLHETLSFMLNKEPKIELLLKWMVRFPQVHCNFYLQHSSSAGLGSTYPRTVRVNLNNPRYFNEKLLWLKYYKYNEDPLVAKCYDKYLVREYVKECGYENILNDLYGVWHSIKEIPWDTLPEEYVLKVSNGCGRHVFKRAGESIDINTAILQLKYSVIRTKKFKVSADLFATRNKQLFICERLMHPNNMEEGVSDYKFYCFNGKPLYLLYIWDRKNGSYHETFKQINPDGTLIDRSDLRCKSEDKPIILPECYHEMLQVASKLSEPFPFVRVDLYNDHGKLIFGELTFTPAGSNVLAHVYKDDLSINAEGLEELGNLVNLEENQREKASRK